MFPLAAMLDGKEVTETSRRFLQNWQGARIAANQKQALREATANERRRLGEEAELEYDGQRLGAAGEGSSIMSGHYARKLMTSSIFGIYAKV